MSAGPELNLQPSVSKACSRCRARKVKCDQKVPQCSPCSRHQEACNITECVAYPYSTIETLLNQINELQARLDHASAGRAAQSTPTIPGPNPITLQPDRSQPGHSGLDRGTLDDASLRKEAEEVGVLAIGGPSRFSEGSYLGGAAGSTFARIFFRQLTLAPSQLPDQRGSCLERSPTTRQAALPPLSVAKDTLHAYIAHVHVWWPLLQLSSLRRTFQRLYHEPRSCDDREKFLVFMVLALGSRETSHKGVAVSHALIDMNDPSSYFQTALRFFHSFHDQPRNLFGIQSVLLLTIWMLDSPIAADTNDLWHLARYAMSAVIEAGLHRHNNDWAFTPEELEVRNRTWWSAYCLERHVATMTGRVLSVREHAIHALMPSPMAFDVLTEAEAAAAPVFHKCVVEPFRHMIRLRKLSGRILESVYIARNPQGHALNTTFQQISAEADAIRLELATWDQQLSTAVVKPSREYSKMKIESSLLQLLLQRPSPTYMVPSSQMVYSCSKAASSAVKNWSRLEEEGGISSVCCSSRQVHAIFLVGIAALYCDWRATVKSNPNPAIPMSVPAGKLWRHENDAMICLNLLRDGVSGLQSPGLARCVEVFQMVRASVYKDRPGARLAHTHSSITPSADGSYGAVDTQDFGTGMHLLGAPGDGIEGYLDQVNDFLDGSVFDVDETLNGWYTALMQEIQQ